MLLLKGLATKGMCWLMVLGGIRLSVLLASIVVNMSVEVVLMLVRKEM